jgi:tRNA modification GTPase
LPALDDPDRVFVSAATCWARRPACASAFDCLGRGRGAGGRRVLRTHAPRGCDRAQEHAQRADGELAHEHLELAAEELRLAHDALGEITGQMKADDLLGRIFSSFCIGK